MSNLHKRTFHRCFLPSFGSFGQAVSEEKIFKNRPMRNKNCLWQPCMFGHGSGQNVQSLERTFYRCFLPNFSSFGWGVSEEKIKIWKVNRRRTPNDGKSSLCLWQGELKRRRCNTYRNDQIPFGQRIYTFLEENVSNLVQTSRKLWFKSIA
jgi:hypothetical protein